MYKIENEDDEGNDLFYKMQETLFKEGNEIFDYIYCLINFDKNISILSSMLYCKYCLKLEKNDINFYIYDKFYERCEKYLEECKKFLDPNYIKKHLEELED